MKLFKDQPEYIYSEEAEEVLGLPGVITSGSKQAPKGQEVYWNACVFNEKEQQIWHGDINITKEEDKLRELASKVGRIRVTPEQPARFKGLKAALKDEWVKDRVLIYEPKDEGDAESS